MSFKKTGKVLLIAGLALALAAPGGPWRPSPSRSPKWWGVTGPYEAYTKQSINGFKMGLEYATNGTMEINGRPIEVIIKDTALKPQNGKQLLTEAYRDDKVDLAVGPVSSAVAVAHAARGPGVQEDPHRGAGRGRLHHRQVLGTATSSAPAATPPRTRWATRRPWPSPGVVIATIAQDYSFGRDGRGRL